uniref:Uncharacterized protein n=1 Tax=Setaria digitata TaxID=48799 RepID=A0A915PVD1_9BILA
MESTDDVVDELLNLVEALSKEPMDEFIDDLMKVSSKDTGEEVTKDLFDELATVDEITENLMEEKFLSEMSEVPFEGRINEQLKKGNVSFEQPIKHLLIALVRALSKDTVDQIRKNLTNITMQKIREEISKLLSCNDSVNGHGMIGEMSVWKSIKRFLNDSAEGELFDNLPIDSVQQSDNSNAINCNQIASFGFNFKGYTMCATVEKNIIYRRNDPGTTREEWCNWPDMPFEEMDNTLNVQQYIQQCIHKDPSDVDTILKAPPGQEEGVWKYEHVRQFCMQLNGLTLLLQDECKPDVCVQMTATEQWIFLCAAHKNPKECSAIDYTRHTLDGAAALLNSNKYFPSRVSIKESSIAKIGSVCRRIYRIFSHAYFHHPELFEKFEAETHLCRRFTVFVKKYNLMANEHLIVPILEQKSLHPQI